MITLESKDIFLGRLVKPFGIRGEIKFLPSDDFWEGVLESRALEMDKQPVTLERFRPHTGGTYVLKMEGVDDRNGAEAVVGNEIHVPCGALDVRFPDHLLPFQVIGRTAKTDDGRVLGSVTAVHFSPAHEVYEITGEAGDRHLVPAVPEIIVSLEREGDEVVVKPIPGLLDE